MIPSNRIGTDLYTSSNKKTPNSTADGDHNRISPLVEPFGDIASAASISPLTLALTTDQRRQPMTTATTTIPNIFGRPMDPAPAPLVYINGGPGVGKEAVAESLAVLLGQDKSWLVDVRGIGRDDNDERKNKGAVGVGEPALPLITPEHPGYFGYFGYYGDEEASLANAEEQEPSSSGGWYEGRGGGTRSESFPNILPDFLKRTNSNHQNDDNSNSLPPSPSPCSDKKLARLLSQPGYSHRIGILPFCAFDTPTGHVAMKTFTTAAKLSRRLFIPIALNCEPGEQMRRAQSLQRQCSHKNKMPASTSTASETRAGSTSTSASTGLGTGTNMGIISGRPSSHSFSFGGRTGNGVFASGSGGKFSSGIGERPNRIGMMGEVGSQTENGHWVLNQRGKREGQEPQRQLAQACPVTPYIRGSEDGEDTPSERERETDTSKGYKLTLDITKSSAFETALQIMELVKRLVAERDAEEQRRQQLDCVAEKQVRTAKARTMRIPM